MQVLLESGKQDNSKNMKDIFRCFAVNNLNYDDGEPGKKGI